MGKECRKTNHLASSGKKLWLQNRNPLGMIVIKYFGQYSEKHLAVYVDNMRIAWRGHHWCHLVADSLDELHEFAHMLGLKREWFQVHASLPHYDVTVEFRTIALTHGAIAADRRMLISRARKIKLELLKEYAADEPQLRLFD